MRILGCCKALLKKMKKKLIDAIELNWESLLITRAIFSYSDFGKNKVYSSPNFYTSRGIDVEVNWKSIGKFEDTYPPIRVTHWHNANFIIRICGALDEFIQSCLEKRKNLKNEIAVIKLIYMLRNKIGAHQIGIDKPKEKHLNMVKKLFKELNITEVDSDKLSNFDLSIDSVLLPIKDKLIEEINKVE